MTTQTNPAATLIQINHKVREIVDLINELPLTKNDRELKYGQQLFDLYSDLVHDVTHNSVCD